MSNRSVSHATFVIERTFDASPARVFRAFSDPVAKAGWFGPPAEKCDLDFRVGGVETNRGGPPGGPIHAFEARYLDIVENERIVSTYTMDRDKTRISVSLATTEFRPEGSGTRLVYTEQGAFLDGHDNAAQREHGCRDLFDALDALLKREAAGVHAS
jgi:uncharacterized protein YndB with AHSA1/START domain